MIDNPSARWRLGLWYSGARSLSTHPAEDGTPGLFHSRYEGRDSTRHDPEEVSAHHGHLVHGGRPNRANFDRVGLVFCHISTDTRQSRGGDAAMLVRGHDTHGHYDLEPRPITDFSQRRSRHLRIR